MKNWLSNFNDSLCRILLMDNSQWSQQMFSSGIRKKVLLNGSKAPALHSKKRENSNAGKTTLMFRLFVKALQSGFKVFTISKLKRIFQKFS